MKKKRLFRMLLPSYWLLTLVAIAVVSIYSFRSLSRNYLQTIQKELSVRATLLGEQLLCAPPERIRSLCVELGGKTATRFTVVAPDGTVLGDSARDPGEMENHARRPEILHALKNELGATRRYSRTLNRDMIYVAIPLRNPDGSVRFLVRAAMPMTVIREEQRRTMRRMALAALLTGLLAMPVGIVVVRRISSPLTHMARAARRFAEGDFAHRIPPQSTVELDELAESLNVMSERLGKTLDSLREQRNEQRAVLSGMDEGVLSVDRKERVIHVNRVAGELLGCDPDRVKRMPVREAIRADDLLELVLRALRTPGKIERDLLLPGSPSRQVQVVARTLSDPGGAPTGALIVLRDVTQLRRLETIRSDFIANVSHELKTPITSIKGFVETLLSDDWDHDPSVRRFLEIIDHQAGRLNAIIDDLLMLSRLEQNRDDVAPTEESVPVLIDNAIDLCRLQAERKKTVIVVECPEDLVARINAPLFEQALVNLLVNAIKYAEEGKTVRLSARSEKGQLLLEVADEGFGIEQRHLSRLFERFYRVDTARSRKLGGTGLGLSIVNHIVRLHDGTVSVESQVGVGSRFLIRIPNGPKPHDSPA